MRHETLAQYLDRGGQIRQMASGPEPPPRSTCWGTAHRGCQTWAGWWDGLVGGAITADPSPVPRDPALMHWSRQQWHDYRL